MDSADFTITPLLVMIFFFFAVGLFLFCFLKKGKWKAFPCYVEAEKGELDGVKGVSTGLRLSQHAQLHCPAESESSRIGNGYRAEYHQGRHQGSHGYSVSASYFCRNNGHHFAGQFSENVALRHCSQYHYVCSCRAAPHEQNGEETSQIYQQASPSSIEPILSELV